MTDAEGVKLLERLRETQRERNDARAENERLRKVLMDIVSMIRTALEVK